jgi:hypothetical protein
MQFGILPLHYSDCSRAIVCTVAVTGYQTTHITAAVAGFQMAAMGGSQTAADRYVGGAAATDPKGLIIWKENLQTHINAIHMKISCFKRGCMTLKYTYIITDNITLNSLARYNNNQINHSRKSIKMGLYAPKTGSTRNCIGIIGPKTLSKLSNSSKLCVFRVHNWVV